MIIGQALLADLRGEEKKGESLETARESKPNYAHTDTNIALTNRFHWKRFP